MGGRAHLVVGGFPIGSRAGHDMDFLRVRMLQSLQNKNFQTTVSQDFSLLEDRLDGTNFVISYMAGPYPDKNQVETLESWLQDGGKWFALHGTSGGPAWSEKARHQGLSKECGRILSSINWWTMLSIGERTRLHLDWSAKESDRTALWRTSSKEQRHLLT